MAKFTPVVLESGYLSAEAINANFAALAELLETLLSRDGTAPNQLEADLDLNGHSLLNTATASDNPTSLVTSQTMKDYVDARAAGLLVQRIEEQVMAPAQTTVTLVDVAYKAGANNLAVYVDGVRKFPVSDYVETGDTTLEFSLAFSGGEVLQAVATEFLGTVSLPSHTHPWSQITGAPVYTTRWPTYAEVTDKPSTFAPSAHTHSTADITSGTGLADARRGIWVQAGTPTAGRVGELWFW